MTGETRKPPLAQRPSTAGAVLLPGVPTLGFGVERYVAEGGGATVFSLEPGDAVTVRDREGRQSAQVAAFAPDGSADTQALGVAANGEAKGLKAILGAGNEQSRSLAGSLQRRGLDIAAARSVDVLGGESRPGDEATLTAERPLVCFVAAPGGPMRVDRQDPPTRIEIFVTPRQPGCARRAPGAGAPGRPPHRPAHRGPYGRGLRGQGRRVHPDHRCAGPGMFRLPGVHRRRPRRGAGALPGRNRDPHADGQRLSGAGPAFEILRPGPASDGRGGARHLRPARQLPLRLHGEILRRHGLSRPRQLHRQFQPRPDALRDRGAARLDGAQLLLQHRVRRRQSGIPGTIPGRGPAIMCCCRR